MTGSHLVMVVDDDQGIREALSDIFSDEGFGVVTANNGEEALRYLSAGKHPCLIFLDLMMPTMDGWEFREQQLADPRLANIPVVVISAVRPPTRAPSAQLVLPKPLEVDQVIEALRQYC